MFVGMGLFGNGPSDGVFVLDSLLRGTELEDVIWISRAFDFDLLRVFLAKLAHLIARLLCFYCSI